MRNQDKGRAGSTQERHNHLSARRLEIIAAERRMPKMHWRWCARGRDIVALLHRRFGPALPDDDAGLDAVKLLAQHYMRLKVDAERVTRSNLRLWAPWLTDEKAIAGIIKEAKDAKRPSAAQLGKAWRVTVDEVADLELGTIQAFTVTQEQGRNRQASRRRKNGASTKRGRPKSQGLKPWQAAGASSKSAYYRSLKKAKTSETKNSHAASYIRTMKRDEFQSHRPPIWIAEMPRADLKRLITVTCGISISLSAMGLDKRMAA